MLAVEKELELGSNHANASTRRRPRNGDDRRVWFWFHSSGWQRLRIAPRGRRKKKITSSFPRAHLWTHQASAFALCSRRPLARLASSLPLIQTLPTCLRIRASTPRRLLSSRAPASPALLRSRQAQFLFARTLTDALHSPPPCSGTNRVSSRSCIPSVQSPCRFGISRVRRERAAPCARARVSAPPTDLSPSTLLAPSSPPPVRSQERPH